MSYILQAPEGFKLNAQLSNIVGVIFAVVLFCLFMLNINKFKSNTEKESKIS